MLAFTLGRTRCTLTFGFAAVVCAAFVFGEAQTAFLGLGCILWHECGHIAALYLLRTPPTALKMTVFGLELAAAPRENHQTEAIVSLAGPTANLLGAGLFTLTPWKTAAGLQLLLGLFHLLPILPLDGGQALQSVLYLFLPPGVVEKCMTVLTLALLLPLCTVGFLLLWQGAPNLTLFLLCLYLLFYLVCGQK